MNFVGADTLYWCDCSEDDCSWNCDENEQGFWVIDSIYEPAALIKDASVNLTDDVGNIYNLTFVEKISFIDTIYFDTSVTIYGTTVNWDTTFLIQMILGSTFTLIHQEHSIHSLVQGTR